MSAAVDPPRGLVIGAGGWFLLALGLSLGSRLPIHMTPASLAPSVRICLIVCSVGSIIAWPLVRLSMEPRERPLASALLDGATLICLYQMVLWPMRLATPWPTERTLLISLVEVAHVLGVCGIVALATATASAWARSLAMVACLVLAFGVHAPFAAAGLPLDALAQWLPGALPMLMTTMDATSSMPTPEDWSTLWTMSAIPCLMLVFVWATAGLWAPRPRAGSAVARGRRVG